MPRQSENDRKQLALKSSWTHPEGTDVIARTRDGSEVRTKTCSVPWMLGEQLSQGYPGHTAVIMLDGFSGGFALDRIRLA